MADDPCRSNAAAKWRKDEQGHLAPSVLVAKELLKTVVQAGASRHVASAVAVALLTRTLGIDAAVDKVGKLEVAEQVEQVAEQCLGPKSGVAAVCKALKERGRPELAKEVSRSHKHRNAAAHPRFPTADLPGRVRSALSPPSCSTKPTGVVDAGKHNQNSDDGPRNACHEPDQDKAPLQAQKGHQAVETKYKIEEPKDKEPDDEERHLEYQVVNHKCKKKSPQHSCHWTSPDPSPAPMRGTSTSPTAQAEEHNAAKERQIAAAIKDRIGHPDLEKIGPFTCGQVRFYTSCPQGAPPEWHDWRHGAGK